METPLNRRIRWLRALANHVTEVVEEELLDEEFRLENEFGEKPSQSRLIGFRDGNELISVYIDNRGRPLGAWPTRLPKHVSKQKYEPWMSKVLDYNVHLALLEDFDNWFIDNIDGANQTLLRLYASLAKKKQMSTPKRLTLDFS